MNLFEICMQVLEEARDSDLDLNNGITCENIASEIYELYYENSKLVNSNLSDTGYFVDVKDYYSNEVSYTRFADENED